MLDPDPYSNCGSGSRRAKMTHKNRRKSKIFMFLSTGCSLLRAEGFSCSLGVLYWGLEIRKVQFLIKKIEIKFPARNFFSFRSSNPGSGSGIRIRNPDPQLEKMLDSDPYPDPHLINADPKPCFILFRTSTPSSSQHKNKLHHSL